jgi:arginine repressor
METDEIEIINIILSSLNRQAIHKTRLETAKEIVKQLNKQGFKINRRKKT